MSADLTDVQGGGMSLLGRFELEDPIECWSCGGLYDLRFWRVLSDETMQCPECKKLSRIEEAIRLTEENTRRWAERSVVSADSSEAGATTPSDGGARERELTQEEYDAWGGVWAVAKDYVELYELYEQWARMGRQDLRLSIAGDIREKLPELEEELKTVGGSRLSELEGEVGRLRGENERLYDRCVKDAVRASKAESRVRELLSYLESAGAYGETWTSSREVVAERVVDAAKMFRDEALGEPSEAEGGRVEGREG
jgi:hypothetical protein